MNIEMNVNDCLFIYVGNSHVGDSAGLVRFFFLEQPLVLNQTDQTKMIRRIRLSRQSGFPIAWHFRI